MGELLIKNIECDLVKSVAMKLLDKHSEFELKAALDIIKEAKSEGVTIDQLYTAVDSSHAEAVCDNWLKDISEAS